MGWAVWLLWHCGQSRPWWQLRHGSPARLLLSAPGSMGQGVHRCSLSGWSRL